MKKLWGEEEAGAKARCLCTSRVGAVLRGVIGRSMVVVLPRPREQLRLFPGRIRFRASMKI